MGQLTTHVLDTAQGKPGAGIRVELVFCGPRTPPGCERAHQRRRPLRRAVAAGRRVRTGRWELVFHVGANTSPTPAWRYRSRGSSIR